MIAALLRDRGALAAGMALLALAAAAWVAVATQGAGMGGGMLPAASGPVPDAALFTLMWAVMMAAMMLPSAIPTIALYGLVSRGERAVPTWAFATVYLLVWLALGVPVYLGSIGVAALGEGGAGAWLPHALAAVLSVAGAYQFTAIKRVCLKHCQSPLTFMMERWHASYGATLRLALGHAAYCVGCCWGLMVILVAAGAMSLPWVLLIAVVVFAEKVLPRGEWTARVVGAALLGLAALVAVRPDLAVGLRGQSVGDTSGPGMAVGWPRTFAELAF